MGCGTSNIVNNFDSRIPDKYKCEKHRRIVKHYNDEDKTFSCDKCALESGVKLI